jgi:hypothetical protein
MKGIMLETQIKSKESTDVLVVEWDQISDDLEKFDPFEIDSNCKNPEYVELSKRFQEIADALMSRGYFVTFVDQASWIRHRIGKCETDWSSAPSNKYAAQALNDLYKPTKIKTVESKSNNNFYESKNKKFEEDKELFYDFIESGRAWSCYDIVELIRDNDYATCYFLTRLYECQTSDEQYSSDTRHINYQGFNAYDAPFLTSLANKYNQKGWLSEKQIGAARKSLVKYQKQLLSIMSYGRN